jgi:hypothetical protein
LNRGISAAKLAVESVVERRYRFGVQDQRRRWTLQPLRKDLIAALGG